MDAHSTRAVLLVMEAIKKKGDLSSLQHRVQDLINSFFMCQCLVLIQTG